MADYKKMYHVLFNRITDIVEELQELQQQTEEMYLCEKEQAIILSFTGNKENNSTATNFSK